MKPGHLAVLRFIAGLAVAIAVLTFVGGHAAAQSKPPKKGGKEEPKEVKCLVCRDSRSCQCMVCNKHWAKAVCFLCRGKKQLPCLICEGAGYFNCGACKGGGKIIWEGGAADTCKPCKGAGKYKCGVCNMTKTVRCSLCKGIGVFPMVCPVCTKGRKLPCHVCSKPPQAQQCSGCAASGKKACISCKRTGKLSFPCFLCSEKGTLKCWPCAGSRKVPCGRCHGCGRVRQKYQDGTTAGMIKCPNCDGRGQTPCTNCADGTKLCVACKGNKRLEEKCWFCAGKGQLECCLCARTPCLVARKDDGIVAYLLGPSAFTEARDNFLTESLKLQKYRFLTLILDNSDGKQDFSAPSIQALLEITLSEREIVARPLETGDLIAENVKWTFETFGGLFDLQEQLTFTKLKVPGGQVRCFVVVFDTPWVSVPDCGANLLLDEDQSVAFKKEQVSLGDLQRLMSRVNPETR